MEDPSINYRVILDHTNADIDDFFSKYYPYRDKETNELIRPSNDQQKKVVVMEILTVVYSIVGLDKFTPFKSDYYSASIDDMKKYNDQFILEVIDSYKYHCSLSEKNKRWNYNSLKSSIVYRCTNFFCIYDDIMRYLDNGIDLLALLNINREHYYDAISKLDHIYLFYLNDISEEDKMWRHQYIPNQYYLDQIRSRRTKSARN